MLTRLLLHFIFLQVVLLISQGSKGFISRFVLYENKDEWIMLVAIWTQMTKSDLTTRYISHLLRLRTCSLSTKLAVALLPILLLAVSSTVPRPLTAGT